MKTEYLLHKRGRVGRPYEKFLNAIRRRVIDNRAEIETEIR